MSRRKINLLSFFFSHNDANAGFVYLLHLIGREAAGNSPVIGDQANNKRENVVPGKRDSRILERPVDAVVREQVRGEYQEEEPPGGIDGPLPFSIADKPGDNGKNNHLSDAENKEDGKAQLIGTNRAERLRHNPRRQEEDADDYADWTAHPAAIWCVEESVDTKADKDRRNNPVQHLETGPVYQHARSKETQW